MAWLPSSSMSMIWMCMTMLFSDFAAADEIVSKCCIKEEKNVVLLLYNGLD
ncbi:TPA: hypothetical protein ACJHMO_003519 [Enterococcus faecalis]